MVFDAGNDLCLCRLIATEFVGDDHSGYIAHALQKPAKELLRSFLVPPRLHENIEYLALLVDRAAKGTAACH